MNTDVYTGADGAILLSSPQNTEGQAAQAVLDQHELTNVGRVQDVRVEVTAEVRAYHEIGQRYATQLRPGNVTIRGTHRPCLCQRRDDRAAARRGAGGAAGGELGASRVQHHGAARQPVERVAEHADAA